MATLVAEVQNRYSAKTLRSLTNPHLATATSSDSDRLQEAADDIESAYFPMYTGVAYDSTDARHVAVAVDGVIVLLQERSNQASGLGERFDAWTNRAKVLASVTSRDRVSPKSSSVLTPSPEQVGSEVVRPKLDQQNFDDVKPDPPRGSERSDINSGAV